MVNDIFSNQVAAFYPVDPEEREKLTPTFFFNYKHLPALKQRFSFATTFAALDKGSNYTFTFYIYQDKIDNEHIATIKTFNVSPSKYQSIPQNMIGKNYETLTLNLTTNEFDIPKGTHTYFVTAILINQNKDPNDCVMDTARTWFATRLAE